MFCYLPPPQYIGFWVLQIFLYATNLPKAEFGVGTTCEDVEPNLQTIDKIKWNVA